MIHYFEGGEDTFNRINDILKRRGLEPVKLSDIEYLKRIARQRGTGYQDRYFRIPKYNLIIVEQAWTSTQFSPYHSIIVHDEDEYNAKNKSYAQQCGIAARKYRIPFPVALALGPELAANLDGFKPTKPSEDQLWALTACGIDRRRAAIKQLLGDDLYDTLGIERMGQTNSTRIAEWLAL